MLAGLDVRGIENKKEGSAQAYLCCGRKISHLPTLTNVLLYHHLLSGEQLDPVDDPNLLYLKGFRMTTHRAEQIEERLAPRDSMSTIGAQRRPGIYSS